MCDPSQPAAPVVTHQEAGMPVATEPAYLVVYNESGVSSLEDFHFSQG